MLSRPRTRFAAVAAALIAMATPAAALADSRLHAHHDKPALGKNRVVQEQAAMRLRATSSTRSRATWCGADRTTDGAGSPAEPHVKLVYAYPSDRPNRFRKWAPLLQGNMHAIRDTYAAASDGRLTVRFDMGTDCGPQYADIMTVALPLPAAAYRTIEGLGKLELVNSAVRALLPSEGRKVNRLIFVDSVATGGCDCLRGSALSYTDSSSNATIHDRGDLSGVVFGVDGWEPPTGSETYFALLFTHELTHTLGAVQPDAPHATGYGHCTDEFDIMCYDDGSGRRLTERCAENDSGAITQALDCGRDDYFNVHPAPGSYLATHWNVARSSFLEAAPPPTVDPPSPVDEPPTTAPTKVSARLRPGRGKAELVRDGRRFIVRVKSVRLRRGTRLRACVRTGAKVRCRTAPSGRRTVTFAASGWTGTVRASVQLRSRSRSLARTSRALVLSSAA